MGSVALKLYKALKNIKVDEQTATEVSESISELENNVNNNTEKHDNTDKKLDLLIEKMSNMQGDIKALKVSSYIIGTLVVGILISVITLALQHIHF